MKKIFIINGSGGVGKDTFVSLVAKEVDGVENYSSVTKIKEIARMIGWNGKKSEKDRKFLSDLKVLCSKYNNMPMKEMQKKIRDFLEGNGTFLFLHIRETNEIEDLKQWFYEGDYDAKMGTVLVVRKSVEPITSNMADAGVYDYEYDYKIDNSGTLEDLQELARLFVKMQGGINYV